MNAPTHFRFLSAGDEADVLEIFDALKTDYEFPMGGSWTTEKLAEEFRRSQVAGALQQGELLAFVIFRESADNAEVMFLATRPSAQRKGIIPSLLKWLAQALRPMRPIWLEVHAQNKPAIAAYKKAGFVQNGERKSYYSDGHSALLFEYKPLQ